MMKKFSVLLCAALVISLTACSNNEVSGTKQTSNSPEVLESQPQNVQSPEETISNSSEVLESKSPDVQLPDEMISNTGEGNILIAYFSVPENANTEGVDAIGSASIVVDEGKVLGNTQFMAQTIQEAVGGDLFRIETVESYPLDGDLLVDQAAQEQDDNVRPELSSHVENIDDYDVIFLGYPNWWADLPMPLYTFLEEYDLSGKTIIPFCPHGGSGFSRTEDTIAELQPDATVSENGFTISRNDVARAQEEITQWADGLGLGN